jgi:hypothetical protein
MTAAAREMLKALADRPRDVTPPIETEAAMTKTQRILATLSFLVALGGTACDGVDRLSPEAPVALAAQGVRGPQPRGGEGGEGCGCGHFTDGDGDGGCDLFSTGECRRGRDGRCPCSGGCPGCL